MRRVPYALSKRFEQARLAHSGFAAEQHEMAVAAGGALPRIEQKRLLALA